MLLIGRWRPIIDPALPSDGGESEEKIGEFRV
jgi:hypothetical protein